MAIHNTDRDWEVLGKLDPYWAVITDDAFHRGDMASGASLAAFLNSGRQHVGRIWDVIDAHLDGDFAPRSAIDFGCGVGRVAIPLAERCDSVLGVDVAESMLAEARSLCQRLNLRNVRFEKGDDSLSRVRGTFDLVHSYIVFQHISADRGLQLFRQLIGKVSEGGVGVLHVLYRNPEMAWLPARLVKASWRRLTRWFRQVPQMRMNAYPLDEVFRLLQAAGIGQVHCILTDHGGCLGVIVCFRRPPGTPCLA